MSDPRVSIILPVYDRLNCLRVAIASALRQTHTDWELIIADDGSSDETRSYLRTLDDPRITVLWLPHSGVPAIVRNTAIRRARGRYLAFLDSDDSWAPTKLATQLEVLEASAGCRWSYTALALVGPDGQPVASEAFAPWVAYAGDIVERLLRLEAHVAVPAVLAERSLIAEVGGFDEGQRFCEDYDMWIRLAVRSPVAVVADPLTTVRTGGHAHYSADRIGAYEGWVRLYGKHAVSLPAASLRALARRRRADSTLVLAGLHASAGHAGAACRALLQGASRPAYPAWYWRAARTAVRATLHTPPQMLDPLVPAPARVSSDRQFGLTIAGALVCLALLPLVRRGDIRIWPIALAVLLAAVSLATPHWLRRPNRAWTGLGHAMQRVTGPAVLAVAYFLLLTPTAIIMRWRRVDILRLRRDPLEPTYWIERPSRVIDRESLTRPY
ncbi:MAG TPA: SxtJ family membrane protein [Gemmatimonadaceae bacterium]|nr:SxtJ family membrane protein [Gemmatimonadaceae bacterium]